MIDPKLNKPGRPKLEKDGKDRDVNDPMFSVECEDYVLDNKECQLGRERWAENQPRAYNLVLQHCPLKLETRLTTEPTWDMVWMNRDVVSLLEMIHDITHNHDETKLGLMAVIEFDMKLYLIY